MTARKDLEKILAKVRKDADDYLIVGVDLHEYADRVQKFLVEANEEDCLDLVTRLRASVPELTTSADAMHKDTN